MMHGYFCGACRVGKLLYSILKLTNCFESNSYITDCRNRLMYKLASNCLSTYRIWCWDVYVEFLICVLISVVILFPTVVPYIFV
jgi:hypothetical protein